MIIQLPNITISRRFSRRCETKFNLNLDIDRIQRNFALIFDTYYNEIINLLLVCSTSQFRNFLVFCTHKINNDVLVKIFNMVSNELKQWSNFTHQQKRVFIYFSWNSNNQHRKQILWIYNFLISKRATHWYLSLNYKRINNIIFIIVIARIHYRIWLKILTKTQHSMFDDNTMWWCCKIVQTQLTQ